MKIKLISLPYIYPVCPLNFNHTKMFVAGDVLTRYYRSKNLKVLFPVASHFTGNTAQTVVKSIGRVYSKKSSNKDVETFRLYKNFYNTPQTILQNFNNANRLLEYYTREILWELHSLNISCDYEHSYTTNHKDFSIFVRTILQQYEKEGLLVTNKNLDLALDYNNLKWKEDTLKLIKSTKFVQPFHKNNILSASSYLNTNWELLRNSGSGVRYKKGLIVDPMFDSELFTIFDLYMILKDKTPVLNGNSKDFFSRLFDSLRSNTSSSDPLIQSIKKHLPCDIFVCEEHLKNWVVKKMYAESLLLHKKYRTKKYFVLGMGRLDGKRMSASRGHSILTKDLINNYGPTITRLIILLSGGNLSKEYSYDRNLPDIAKNMLDHFTSYLIWLKTKMEKTSSKKLKKEKFPSHNHEKIVEGYLEKGDFRQAIIELIVIVPKKYNNPNTYLTNMLLSLYEKYIEIFLPSFYKDFFI